MDNRKMVMSVEDLARQNRAFLLRALEERRAASKATARAPQALASAASRLSLAKREYKCRICNRTFRTFQALGGHMAHHAKVTPNVDGQEVFPPKDAKIHECDECHARFSIRLALIGHQRKHIKASSKRCCVRRAQTATHRDKPVLPFDLNHKPAFPFDLNLPASED